MQFGWCSCAQSPFQALFGEPEHGKDAASESSDVDDSEGYDPFVKQDRTPEQVRAQISKWIPLLNARVTELWPNGAKDPNLLDALRSILAATDARDDPVTNPYEHVCALWYGEVGVDDNAAVLKIRGGDGNSTLSYVVRLLAYLFADDATFDLLQQQGGDGPLPMSCDNMRCVNITHCIIPD